jgi:hypothetical protein
MGRIRRILVACGALHGGLPGAAAAGETLALLPSPLEMPRRIGPLVTDGVAHSYEDPRLGSSYQYHGRGLSLTIYVYDAGVDPIPDGADNIPVCEQFEDAKNGVTRAGYRDMALKSEQMVRLAPPGDVLLAREAVFEFVRQERKTFSYVWITAAAKNFIKLRFSLDAELQDEIPEARRALLDALGEAVSTHVQPADPEAGKAGSSMAFNMGSGSDDDTATQFTYMLLLSAMTVQVPEQTPVCGGNFIPGFDTELAVFRQLAAIDGQGGGTKFGKRLAEAEAAGFLDELTWTEMHRDEWGTGQPPGLSLDEYKTWKKKHLKRFRRPKLGAVSVDRPRRLPMEPPAG